MWARSQVGSYQYIVHWVWSQAPLRDVVIIMVYTGIYIVQLLVNSVGVANDIQHGKGGNCGTRAWLSNR